MFVQQWVIEWYSKLCTCHLHNLFQEINAQAIWSMWLSTDLKDKWILKCCQWAHIYTSTSGLHLKECKFVKLILYGVHENNMTRIHIYLTFLGDMYLNNSLAKDVISTDPWNRFSHSSNNLIWRSLWFLKTCICIIAHYTHSSRKSDPINIDIIYKSWLRTCINIGLCIVNGPSWKDFPFLKHVLNWKTLSKIWILKQK